MSSLNGALANLTRRAHVPKNKVPGIWVTVIVVQVSVSIRLLGTWTLRVILCAGAHAIPLKH